MQLMPRFTVMVLVLASCMGAGVNTDLTAPEDADRAEALVRAIGLPRVCRAGYGVKSECEGMRGGLLRFSRAYGVAPDSAVIYASYEGLGNVIRSDMMFQMVRRAHGWQMLS